MAMTTCESAQMYDILLVLCLMYPFKTAYTSLVASMDVIQHNESLMIHMSPQQQAQARSSIKPTSATTATKEPVKSEEAVEVVQAQTTLEEQKAEEMKPTKVNSGEEDDDDGGRAITRTGATTFQDPNSKWRIELSVIAVRMLIVQCTLETLPGLVLQSVFWVKSFNDARLRDDASSFILFSIIASLISISSRYVWIIDRDWVIADAKHCTPWNAVRILYRLLSIVACFVVFVLMWVVVGGAYLGGWCCILFIAWTVIATINGDAVCSAWSLKSGNENMIGLTLAYPWPYHALKFLENLIGMVIIFIFLWSTFDCPACVDPDTREVYQGQNNRVGFLFAFGWVSCFGTIVLYSIMKKFHILIDPKEIQQQ